jgi:hypothetical protein
MDISQPRQTAMVAIIDHSQIQDLLLVLRCANTLCQAEPCRHHTGLPGLAAHNSETPSAAPHELIAFVAPSSFVSPHPPKLWSSGRLGGTRPVGTWYGSMRVIWHWNHCQQQAVPVIAPSASGSLTSIAAYRVEL